MSLSSTIESSVITNIAFWVVSISVIVSSFAVVQIRDLFRAALFLVLAFVGIAGMFILLRAEFLAVVQILIYVGAISVLIIFAILMTRDVSDGNPHNRLRIPASILGLVFFVVFTFVMVQVDWNVQPVPEPIPDTPQSDSVEIFTKFSYLHICFWFFCDPKHSGSEFAANREVQDGTSLGAETRNDLDGKLDPDQDQSGLDKIFIDTIPSIAGLLLRDFVLAFELVSILLLAAMIGALTLIREK
jgi:NADH-quinone oxidoreductase subunit J